MIILTAVAKSKQEKEPGGMNEQEPRPIPPSESTEGSYVPEQYPTADTHRLPLLGVVDVPEDQELQTGQEAAEGLRKAYEGWLERRGIDPAHVPRLTMDEQAFDLFRNVPRGYQEYARKVYGIPQDDQDNCRYALVDRKPANPNLPSKPELMIVDEADFGTILSPRKIAKDFQDSGPDSGGPAAPNLPGGAYKTVDIADTIAVSYQKLSTFARELMAGQTIDPFSGTHGDIGVRAGGLAPGQKDAYV